MTTLYESEIEQLALIETETALRRLRLLIPHLGGRGYAEPTSAAKDGFGPAYTVYTLVK